MPKFTLAQIEEMPPVVAFRIFGGLAVGHNLQRNHVTVVDYYTEATDTRVLRSAAWVENQPHVVPIWRVGADEN